MSDKTERDHRAEHAEREALRLRFGRVRRSSIHGVLIAGPEVGPGWLASLAEETRTIIAERQREWENAVLRECVENMPATGDCADFMSVVSTAMLALRTSPGGGSDV